MLFRSAGRFDATTPAGAMAQFGNPGAAMTSAAQGAMSAASDSRLRLAQADSLQIVTTINDTAMEVIEFVKDGRAAELVRSLADKASAVVTGAVEMAPKVGEWAQQQLVDLGNALLGSGGFMFDKALDGFEEIMRWVFQIEDERSLFRFRREVQ